MTETTFSSGCPQCGSPRIILTRTHTVCETIYATMRGSEGIYGEFRPSEFGETVDVGAWETATCDECGAPLDLATLFPDDGPTGAHDDEVREEAQWRAAASALRRATTGPDDGPVCDPETEAGHEAFWLDYQARAVLRASTTWCTCGHPRETHLSPSTYCSQCPCQRYAPQEPPAPTFPAGMYYVGDLCCVLSRETWSALPCPPRTGASWSLTVAGQPAWMGWTAYGDGVYADAEGHTYGVDSGSLGVIPTSACDATRLQETDLQALGRIVIMDEPFVPQNQGGRFVIGPLVIDTRGLDEEGR